MGSLLDDLMSAIGVDALMHQRGQSATYSPAGGTPVTLTAILGDERTEEDDEFDGRRSRQVRSATIAKDPNCEWGGVAAPATNATMTADGVIYAVRSIESETESLVTLALQRKTQIERSRQRYRR